MKISDINYLIDYSQSKMDEAAEKENYLSGHVCDVGIDDDNYLHLRVTWNKLLDNGNKFHYKMFDLSQKSSFETYLNSEKPEKINDYTFIVRIKLGHYILMEMTYVFDESNPSGSHASVCIVASHYKALEADSMEEARRSVRNNVDDFFESMKLTMEMAKRFVL